MEPGGDERRFRTKSATFAMSRKKSRLASSRTSSGALSTDDGCRVGMTGPAHSDITSSPRCCVTRKPLPSSACAAVLPSATTTFGFTSRISSRSHGLHARNSAALGFTKSTALDGRKYDICCGQINIGNAATPLTARMADGVHQPDGTRKPEPTIDAKHISDAVVYMASLPLDVNALTVTVMATQMPFAGRG